MNAFLFHSMIHKTWIGITDQVMGGVSDLAIRHSDGVFYMSGMFQLIIMAAL